MTTKIYAGSYHQPNIFFFPPSLADARSSALLAAPSSVLSGAAVAAEYWAVKQRHSAVASMRNAGF